MLHIFKQYLTNLAGLVRGASVKESKKESAWNVATQDGKIITVDALLADEAHEEGWLRAIAEFQAAVTKSFQDT